MIKFDINLEFDFKLKNLAGHFKTITQHRHQVMIHCFKAGVPLRGLLHDLSKYTPEEFIYGVKYYTGTKSPNEGERAEYGYSNAWMHHKGRNKHHFEYWNDYGTDNLPARPVKMPLKYVIEMFCDRVAASKIYKGEAYTDSCPIEYFETGKAKRTIHPETSDFLEKLLKMLADKGEDYTFRYIRFYRLFHKDY